MTPRPLARSALAIAAGGALLAGVLAVPAAVAEPAAPAAESPLAAAAIEPPEALTLVGFLPYNSAKLRRAAQRISSPGTANYRAFLPLREAGTRFGADREARRDLKRTAASLGLTAVIDPSGLVARITGPTEIWVELYGRAPVFSEALPFSLSTMFPSQETAESESPALAREVPEPLRPVLRALIPESVDLIDVPAPSSTVLGGASIGPADDTLPVNEGSPYGPGEECVTEQAEQFPEAGASTSTIYSPSQLHVPYGTTALRNRGYDGAGARLTIVGLGQAYDVGTPAIAADCFGYAAPTIVNIGATGLPDEPIPGIFAGPLPDGESDLDIQVSAPVIDQRLGISFVQAQQGQSLVRAVVDGFTTAYARTSPDSLSLSYGECIPELEAAGDWRYARFGDDVLALGAILGTSLFTGAGDSGSSGCLHGGSSIDAVAPVWPGGSPWITAAGGTRIVLGAGNGRVNEVTWNDTPFGDPNGFAAGGGGVATYPRPWYQGSVTSGDRRVFPDVAAHASELVGWPVFGTLLPGVDDTVILFPEGGTSAASPFTAANLALISAYERAAGRPPLGFVNPWLYDVARSGAYVRAFFDIVNGTNQVVASAGCCRATPGFDLATGIGAPDFNELARLVPPPGARARAR